MTTSIRKYVNQLLQAKLELPSPSVEISSIGGGCINETYQLRTNDNRKFFLKVNSATKYPALFAKEKHGLEQLASHKIIHVPSVVAYGELDNYQMLLLEWIDSGARNEKFWTSFGEQLARLHQQTWLNKQDGTLFGLDQGNYIGSLPQINKPHDNWIDFFSYNRLQPQSQLAKDSGLLQKKHVDAFDKLLPKLQPIFNDERSALLHGDLWSGNFMCDQNSQPVLIDPAVYFGHRSMDLAMTTLFGGFDRLFYEAYSYHFPLPKNYQEQWDICNLYPLLIHLNLFGTGYLGQIENILRKWN